MTQIYGAAKSRRQWTKKINSHLDHCLCKNPKLAAPFRLESELQQAADYFSKFKQNATNN